MSTLEDYRSKVAVRPQRAYTNHPANHPANNDYPLVVEPKSMSRFSIDTEPDALVFRRGFNRKTVLKWLIWTSVLIGLTLGVTGFILALVKFTHNEATTGSNNGTLANVTPTTEISQSSFAARFAMTTQKLSHEVRGINYGNSSVVWNSTSIRQTTATATGDWTHETASLISAESVITIPASVPVVESFTGVTVINITATVVPFASATEKASMTAANSSINATTKTNITSSTTATVTLPSVPTIHPFSNDSVTLSLSFPALDTSSAAPMHTVASAPFPMTNGTTSSVPIGTRVSTTMEGSLAAETVHGGPAPTTSDTVVSTTSCSEEDITTSTTYSDEQVTTSTIFITPPPVTLVITVTASPEPCTCDEISVVPMFTSQPTCDGQVTVTVSVTTTMVKTVGDVSTPLSFSTIHSTATISNSTLTSTIGHTVTVTTSASGSTSTHFVAESVVSTASHRSTDPAPFFLVSFDGKSVTTISTLESRPSDIPNASVTVYETVILETQTSTTHLVSAQGLPSSSTSTAPVITFDAFSTGVPANITYIPLTANTTVTLHGATFSVVVPGAPEPSTSTRSPATSSTSVVLGNGTSTHSTTSIGNGTFTHSSTPSSTYIIQEASAPETGLSEGYAWYVTILLPTMMSIAFFVL